MTHRSLRSTAGGVFALATLGLIMHAQSAIAMGAWVEGEETDNCNKDDGALDEAAFVITTAPKAGDRVENGFAVAGCSRTFEGSVEWKLVGRDGSAEQIQQRSDQRRSRRFERLIQGALFQPLSLVDALHLDQQAAVEQIGALRDDVDPVDHQSAPIAVDDVAVIRVELPLREALPRDRAAERIREPGTNVRDVVERHKPTTRRGDRPLLRVLRLSPCRRGG